MATESVFVNDRVRDGNGVPVLDPGGGSGTLYTDLATEFLYVWNDDGSGWQLVSGGGSGGITVGTTTITGGTSGRVLYDNAGVVGEMTTTGTGTVLALATSPSFTTPALGTPTAGVLSSCTGYAVSALTGLGANVATFLATPSSANLASAVTDETGSGVLVFGTSPTFTTSLVGAAGLTIGLGTANVWEQYNGSSAQSLFVYNTRTDASNYERVSLYWNSNAAFLHVQQAGTGNDNRDLVIQTEQGVASSSSIGIKPGTTGRVKIDGGGTTLFEVTALLASTGSVQIGAQLNRTDTSGTLIIQNINASFSPSSTSTMVAIPLKITPTINYSNGTPGAGSYEALKIAVTETALPTGTNYLIRASAGAAGTTDKFTVLNTGAVTTSSTLTTLGGATFHTTSSALTDGAGGSTGTLTTAPSAGNPTKWIGINDNGTTRYIPAW